MEINIATQSDIDRIADLAIAFRNHLERNVPSDCQFRTSVSNLLISDEAEFYLASKNNSETVSISPVQSVNFGQE